MPLTRLRDKFEVGGRKWEGPKGYLAKIDRKGPPCKKKTKVIPVDIGGQWWRKYPKKFQGQNPASLSSLQKKGTEGDWLRPYRLPMTLLKALWGELELRVETAEGKESEFRILLPI